MLHETLPSGTKNTLSRKVLVLNRLWQAVNVCTARRAFSLVYRGHADIVVNDRGQFATFDFEGWKRFSANGSGEELVRAVSFEIGIPRIIVLRLYARVPVREVKFTRKNIYERDGYRCQYCGKTFSAKGLNIDHVVPVRRGGKTTWENVVCSCLACNTRKGSRTLRQAGMKLIRRPRKPRWQNFLLVKFDSNMDESWRHFVDVRYWNIELGEEAVEDV